MTHERGKKTEKIDAIKMREKLPNMTILEECIEKIRRIENKIAFIYTSMVIVIENKCDTAYLDFI